MKTEKVKLKNMLLM